MKKTINHSSKATLLLVERAHALGLTAQKIERSTGQHRRPHPLGSTSVPQKIVTIAGIRMSVGQAREYLAARS